MTGAAKKEAAEVQAEAVRKAAEMHASGTAAAASKMAAANRLAAEAKFKLGKQRLQLDMATEQAKLQQEHAKMNWEQLMSIAEGYKVCPYSTAPIVTSILCIAIAQMLFCAAEGGMLPRRSTEESKVSAQGDVP